MKLKHKLLIVIAALSIAAWALPAAAHGVSLWAYCEDGKVYVEAFFSNGNKVQGGQLIVLDSKGDQLLTGTTDDQGKFDFEPPVIDDLKIILIAGEGHGAEFELPKDELQQAAPQPTPQATPQQTPQETPGQKPESTP